MYDLDLLLGKKPERLPNGRFMKGNIPHNKGKKWSEWMDGRKQRKVRKCLIHTGNPTLAGWNKRAVIAYKDGVSLWFESVTDAAKKLNLQRRNVQHVVQGHRPTCGGWRFKRSTVQQYGMKK